MYYRYVDDMFALFWDEQEAVGNVCIGMYIGAFILLGKMPSELSIMNSVLYQ